MKKVIIMTMGIFSFIFAYGLCDKFKNANNSNGNAHIEALFEVPGNNNADDVIAAYHKKLNKQHTLDSINIEGRLLLFDVPYNFENEGSYAKSMDFSYGMGFTLYFYLVCNGGDENPFDVKLNHFTKITSGTIVLDRENLIFFEKISDNIYLGSYLIDYHQEWNKDFFRVIIENQNNQPAIALLGVSVSMKKVEK
jgi:hypothetical protein